jgi:hypothetical protein
MDKMIPLYLAHKCKLLPYNNFLKIITLKLLGLTILLFILCIMCVST